MKQSVLIIEDDPNILLGLQEVLRGEGFAVCVCERGDQATAAVLEHQPDMVILDVMLPGLSGYEVCRQLRERGLRTPILMLTAKGQELDKVVGLNLGADDYVVKPFGVKELIARVHALLRRMQSAPLLPNELLFTIGESEIDARKFELRRGKKIETLSAKELKLLQLFHQHPGEVLSRDRLLSDVWGYNYFGTTRTLDQVIVQLRKKLGHDGPKHLLTVHGVGYKLAP
jgi:DNA-binding response OmpR family regulator